MEDMYLTQKQKRSVVAAISDVHQHHILRPLEAVPASPVANLVKAGSKLHNGRDMPRSFWSKPS